MFRFVWVLYERPEIVRCLPLSQKSLFFLLLSLSCHWQSLRILYIPRPRNQLLSLAVTILISNSVPLRPLLSRSSPSCIDIYVNFLRFFPHFHRQFHSTFISSLSSMYSDRTPFLLTLIYSQLIFQCSHSPSIPRVLGNRQSPVLLKTLWQRKCQPVDKCGNVGLESRKHGCSGKSAWTQATNFTFFIYYDVPVREAHAILISTFLPNILPPGQSIF